MSTASKENELLLIISELRGRLNKIWIDTGNPDADISSLKLSTSLNKASGLNVVLQAPYPDTVK